MKKGKILAIVMAMAVTAGAMAVPVKAASSAEEAANQARLCVAFVKNSDAKLDDWNVFAVARTGREGNEALFTAYYESLVLILNDPNTNIPLSDYVKYAAVLTAAGIDPRDVEGRDLLAKINGASDRDLSGFSTSSLSYTLSLIKRYPDSFSADYLQKVAGRILAAKQADGGFEYIVGSGYGSDSDSTAQAIQGLALLGDGYASEVQAAAGWLEAKINADGAIAGWDNKSNPSSTAQALIAFSQLGAVPQNAQGKSLYDGLKGFLLPDHSFQDADFMTGQLAYNAFATSQGVQGMAAYSRMLQGQKPLFDLSDATVAPFYQDGGSSSEPESSSSQQEGSSSSEPENPSSRPESSSSQPEPSSQADDYQSPKTGDMGVGAIVLTAGIAMAAVWVLKRNEKH